MSVDLTKLTPAPWHSGAPAPELCRCRGFRLHSHTCYNVWSDEGTDVTNPCAGLDLADAEFIALARNDFDIRMKRGWCVVKTPLGWVACEMKETFWGLIPKIVMEAVSERAGQPGAHTYWPDPITAVLEADKWYRENVEGKEATA